MQETLGRYVLIIGTLVRRRANQRNTPSSTMIVMGNSKIRNKGNSMKNKRLKPSGPASSPSA